MMHHFLVLPPAPRCPAPLNSISAIIINIINAFNSDVRNFSFAAFLQRGFFTYIPQENKYNTPRVETRGKRS
jgi:hypothetical protein